MTKPKVPQDGEDITKEPSLPPVVPDVALDGILVADPYESAGSMSPMIATLTRSLPSTSFVRAHRQAMYSWIYDKRTDGQRGVPFIATPSIRDQFPHFRQCEVRPWVDRGGHVLFRYRPAARGGFQNGWDTSDAEMTAIAWDRWLMKLPGDINDGRFRWQVSANSEAWGDPIWPAEDLWQIYRRTVARNVVSSVDHPVCRALLGLTD